MNGIIIFDVGKAVELPILVVGKKGLYELKTSNAVVRNLPPKSIREKVNEQPLTTRYTTVDNNHNFKCYNIHSLETLNAISTSTVEQL